MDTRAHSPKLAALAMQGATLAGAEVTKGGGGKGYLKYDGH